MKIEGFTVVSHDFKKREWLQGSPFAALDFVSSAGQTAHSRLTALMVKMGVDDIPVARDLADRIAEALLKTGNIFEIREHIYAPLPPYSIQRGSKEWTILGDTKVDRILAGKGPLYKRESRVEDDGVLLRRTLVAEVDTASALFERAGVRAYGRDDLLELVPHVDSLVFPVPWPGFEPSAYAKWEVVDKSGSWVEIQSRASTPEGLCRGSVVDQKGQVLFVRYFFRHREGWSPLTSDEASLWVLRMAAVSGHPFTAQHFAATNKLHIGSRIPHAAYVALRLLGREVVAKQGQLVVEGIDYHTSEIICARLGIGLVVGRDQ